jgi:hypothetical protein
MLTLESITSGQWDHRAELSRRGGPPQFEWRGNGGPRFAGFAYAALAAVRATLQCTCNSLRYDGQHGS